MPDAPTTATDAGSAAGRVRAARRPWIVRGFTRYMRWYVARNLNAVRLLNDAAPQLPDGCPVIVCLNHPSWWDPALIVVLQEHFMGARQGFGPMDSAALARYRVMEKVGLFGIAPGTPSGARDFLSIGRGLLQQSDTVLWVTAQGHFTDSRSRPVELRRGLAHLLRQVPQAVVLPLAIEIGFWNERTPEAFAAFGPPVDHAPDEAPDTVNLRLAGALAQTMDHLAAAVIARDPAAFQTILRGHSGVGGSYDLARRLKSWASGRRFDAAHEPGRDQPP